MTQPTAETKQFKVHPLHELFHANQTYGALTTALNLPAHPGHEHRTGADGFAVVPFIIKSQIQVPPVVK
jgi:hypothetical protein